MLKLPDSAQSFVFCSQILVNKIKIIGMLLHFVHHRVHKDIEQGSLMGFITILLY